MKNNEKEVSIQGKIKRGLFWKNEEECRRDTMYAMNMGLLLCSKSPQLKTIIDTITVVNCVSC